MYKFNIATKEVGSKFIWAHSERLALKQYFDWANTLGYFSDFFDDIKVKRIQKRTKFYNVKLPITKAKMKRLKNQLKKEKRKGV